MGVVTKPDLASGRILVGNDDNKGDDVVLSGDATMASDGGITVDNVTVGSDAVGDINYKTSATASSRVGIGNAGETLRANTGATAPGWSDKGKAYTHIQGSHTAPVCLTDGGAVVTGADTELNHCQLGQDLPMMVVYNMGTNDANLVPLPIVDANCCDGLQLPIKNGDNLGVTLTFGASLPNLTATTGAHTCYTIGTDPAFYMKCKLGIPDITDWDVLFVGFVQPAAAYVAVADCDTNGELLTAYANKAGFALGDALGDIDTMTSIAGSDVSTDISVTDWADDDVMTMETKVSVTGAITYRFWDAAGAEDTSLTAVAATIAPGVVLTPCIIAVKGSNATDTPPIIEYIEWGYQ